MLEFTALPYASFKDNITYGVFRRHELAELMRALAGKLKYFSIGSAHNEYTILKLRGVVVREAILKKRYKNFPPGHILDVLVAKVRGLFNSHANKETFYSPYTISDHLSDLKIVLYEYGLAGEIVDRAIALNRVHLGCSL